MRPIPGPRRLAVLGAGLALVAATVGCASDDPNSGTNTTGTITTGTIDVSAPPSSVAPTATSVEPPPATPPVSGSPDSTEVGTTLPPGPLAEPSIGLFEIGTFDQPVEIAVRQGAAQTFVVEQPGRVVAVTDLSSDVVLDIADLTDADGERGLLGLAFHPTQDLAYVNYTDDSGDTVVAEFAVDPTSSLFDRDTAREVLTVDQPYSNHNGGKLAFGPDGMLYIGLGDGGSRNDPDRVALDLGSRLGKILRIDPMASGGTPFAVPADNPFVGVEGADATIWAFGLRNPWRFSFDPETGDLWIADVGQGDIEEIDHAPATDRADAAKGLNFGWSAFEGTERFNDDQSPDGAVPPVHTYGHGDGRCSVSGGAVGRGTTVPDLDGWYVFGDYCTGEIWALDTTSLGAEPRVIDLTQLPRLAAISQGPDRELYAVSNAGVVARLVAG